MSDDLSQLDAMIATLRKLGGHDVVREIVKQAAPLVDEALKSTASAGTTPTGEAWKPKKDGTRPMVHAAAHISTAAYGSVIRATVKGPDAGWNYGWRGIKRQVLPDAGTIPPAVEKAMQLASARAFERVVGEAA